MKLIKFETAKIAKEKGFNIEVYDYYYNGELRCDSAGYGIDDGVSNHKDLRGNFNSINEDWLKTIKYHYESIKDLSLDELRIFWNNKDIKDHIKEIETKKASLDNYLAQCSAPTQSELQEWLRDVHGIDIIVDLSLSNLYNKNKRNYFVDIYCTNLKTHPKIDKYIQSKEIGVPEGGGSHKFFTSYEEALEAGLRESLKLI